ncbi:hypothetical protein [Bdellovibrio bacteriovorus]|uniref:hypothetical protein n=1 Tax=Bdellovibrio TaxID=958 RepID=UPI0035A940D3
MPRLKLPSQMTDKPFMVKQFKAEDQYELMWAVSKAVDPMEFPEGNLSYFILHPKDDGVFEVEHKEDTYTEDHVFRDTVACYIGCRKIYGVVSYLRNQLTLSFCGIRFYAEFIFQNNEWQLLEFDDSNIRLQTPAEMRLEISSDLEKIKKFLS